MSQSIDIEVACFLHDRTKEGMVELKINDTTLHMDLPQARRMVKSISEAIEAAVSDQILYMFLISHVRLDEKEAGRALLDFRELRQGSRDAVNPH